MKKVVRVTDEQIVEAVKSSNNIWQVLDKFGYSRKSNAYSITDRISKLGIDTSHFKRGSRRRWTDDQLSEAVKTSNSMAQVLLKLGYSRNSGGIYTFIIGYIKKLGINIEHFTGQGHLKGKTHNWNKTLPLEGVMTKNSTYSTKNLKRRLFKLGLLQNKCSKCGLPPEWNGEPISLHMDHINGDHHDNRLENLRILCPNCHSQTPTFGAKRLKKPKPPKRQQRQPRQPRQQRQPRLGPAAPTPSELDPNWRHRSKPNTRKTEWPSKEELLKLLWEIPTTKIAEQFGVSDQAVGKWAMLYGIDKPPRGYWAKQAANERQCC